jgi:carbon-monoxide dehydrogenase medium subunit
MRRGGTDMDFVDAHELPEALSTLDELGSEATVLAGGTDVMVQYLRGEIAPQTLLHIRRLGVLKGIDVNGGTRLGALTTHWELMTDVRITREHLALSEAAATVGGRQTQNVGTVAGNVVNASPAADLLPALLVANAAVALQSSAGERELPLTDFLLGRKRTARAPNELVTRITLERPGPRTGEVYLKVGRRRAMEVAVVGLAARLAFGEEGAVKEARIAVCSVAPTCYRASEAEAVLTGSRLEKDVIAEAGVRLRQSASPIDDPRATAAYRSRVLAPLLSQALEICRARAGL